MCENRKGKKLNLETTAKSGDFIVGSQHKETGALSIAPHATIQSYDSAVKEAARLAKTVTDKRFIVMEFRGVCSYADVTWD